MLCRHSLPGVASLGIPRRQRLDLRAHDAEVVGVGRQLAAQVYVTDQAAPIDEEAYARPRPLVAIEPPPASRSASRGPRPRGSGPVVLDCSRARPRHRAARGPCGGTRRSRPSRGFGTPRRNGSRPARWRCRWEALRAFGPSCSGPWRSWKPSGPMPSVSTAIKPWATGGSRTGRRRGRTSKGSWIPWPRPISWTRQQEARSLVQRFLRKTAKALRGPVRGEDLRFFPYTPVPWKRA